jgi:hypothetical protein
MTVVYRGLRSSLMVFDDEAGAQYLYGGVDRMRSNIATSQAAYAEACKRTARDRSIATAGISLAQAIGKGKRKSQLSVSPINISQCQGVIGAPALAVLHSIPRATAANALPRGP